MTITARRLLDLTAADLMSREVVAIPLGMSPQAAAHRLAQAGVSGAPVIDSTGRCVGVLSRTDLFRFFEQKEDHPHEPYPETASCYAEWQVFDEPPPEVGDRPDDVSRYMTTKVIMASPDIRVGELARIMHRNHIHRVLIADLQGRVIGIVSSMDVLAAFAENPDSPE